MCKTNMKHTLPLAALLLALPAAHHAAEPALAATIVNAGTLPRLSPRPVSDEGVDLAGTWRFNGDAVIQVPGEWVMQGFTVTTNEAAHYQRTFTVPNEWKGKRIKLRCDGVYSDATVSINGKAAGKHLGGFTPFELDVTDLVLSDRQNTIELAVISESLADRLACGSQYACHPLGGIMRKIRLFALPETNISALRVATKFDKDYRDATLELEMETATEGAANPDDLKAALALTAPDGSNVPVPDARVKLNPLKNRLSIPVAHPLKWDHEHPNLYTLTVKLEQAGKVLETVSQRIGFRQVEVRGNQLFLNNVPIKLRGVNRHETHPLRGRSLTPELWRKDAELYRAGNCNLIRTSHYPPAEEFLEACDELGLLVELEAPFCWVGHGASKYYKRAPDGDDVYRCLLQGNLETIVYSYNHPSVIIRSLANESSWSKLFANVHAAVREADPTRPTTFHDQCWGNYNNHGSTEMPIGNMHYPGAGGATLADKEPRPICFGEYCHLFSYNRLELATDPGLRDLWGAGLEMIWEPMRKSQGCLGGAIWAGVDDTFFIPNGDTVGYGTWGQIDGWRRPKPEYWNMKKVYSPVKLDDTGVPANQPVRIKVENRHDFTDLSELRFEWKLGDKSGFAKTKAAPGKTGVLEIPVTGDGQLLEVRALSPRGFVEDVWQIALGKDPRVALPIPAVKPGRVTLEKNPEKLVIRGAGSPLTVDAKTGMFSSPFVGPELLLLPRNGDKCGGTQMTGKEPKIPIFSDTCHDWQATSVTAQTTDDGVEIRVEGAYTEARGTYTHLFGNDGSIKVRYAFQVTAKDKFNPRQIGVVFNLPSECQTLTWRRKAHWSFYPDDHIGRAQGTATAFVKGVPLSSLAGPRNEPGWSWGADGNEAGANDFRSTKMNIFEASLLSPSGSGLRVLGDGSQHVRSWISGNRSRLLVAQYANEGSPSFFRERVIPQYAHTTKDKAAVEGVVDLEVRTD